MLLLALDTSSPQITVAIHDGSTSLVARTQTAAQGHGELLAPMVAEAISAIGARPADLTAIAVGVGPGPFTGLRVGLATAVVLGYVVDVAVYGVCSLDAVAAAARDRGIAGPLAATSDALRGEVHWACYDAAGRRGDGPHVGPPDVAAAAIGARPVVGPGAARYPEAFAGRGDAGAPVTVAASCLADLAAAALARGEPLLPPQPLYLRRPDAVAGGNRKPVLR
ncbi:MAG: tRNA (adenosine(37)-N6)-threonylcarbamoyltransferase complex dimerization subunit type 1 TsaB [Actinomycetota bacterium]|nr:MAG: tRNA (adenosine(37)-N6)-threonylcarbamoyltransferase complex dimerization subunit type 1 TsaB [Actinomycetota bacterium]